MTAGHSVLPPSSSARRVQCPLSTTLEARYPEVEDSVEAAEGEAAHWGTAEQLSGRLVDIGVIAPNGIPLTLDMCQAADLVFDYVSKVLAPHGLKPSDGHVEQPVVISHIHPQAWGTPDYWIRLPDGTLFLLDFKYGHRYVPAYENWQLLEYLVGIAETVGWGAAWKTHAVIVQPRSFSRDGPIREWKSDMVKLAPLVQRAMAAAHEALGPEPVARVGPECRDCRGRHACPALQRAAQDAMDEAVHVVPLELPLAALSLELRLARRAADLLKARITGLEEQTTAALKRGEAVPGWGIQHAAGREKWTATDAEVIALGAALGVSVAKPAEAMTPNQARLAGFDPGVVAAMSTRSGGAASLVEGDVGELRRVFG